MRRTTKALAGFSAATLGATGILDEGGPMILAAILAVAAVGFAKLGLEALKDEEDE